MTLSAHDERLLKALAVAIVDRPRATLKELAESAGVSKATLHRFCGTRDGLMAMLEDYGHVVIRQILEAAGLQQAEPLEALRGLIAEHLKHRDMLNFLLFQYRAENLDMEATAERYGRAASSSSAHVLEQLFLHGALVQRQG